MERFDAWHLPPDLMPGIQTTSLDLDPAPTAPTRAAAEPFELRAPALTADHVRRIATALLAAGDTLRATPLNEIVAAIDAVAARFLDPADELRVQALAWIPRTTGYSAAMAELVLDRMAADWRAPELHALLRAELRDPRVLDRFVRHRPGQYVRAFGPRLALHVLAGNVPGVGVTSLVRSLLVRAPALCKTAREEPVLPVLFARALRDQAPPIGDALAVAWWPGGDVALEAAALENAELVVHYGGAQALASLAARLPPHVRLVDHGPRISFGIVARERLGDPDLPAKIARATATFDQQGCVSPHLVFLEGPPTDAAREFAGRIAHELATLAPKLSRGRITCDEAARIHAARATAEFRAIRGEDVALWADPNLHYTVIYDPRPEFGASCLNRTLWCRPITLDALPGLIQPFAPFLQSVAVAASPARQKALAASLGAAGVTRMTCFDSLPWPSPTWHHDGRGPLRELLRWVDFEPS
jgi:hypothetical protein